MSDPWQSSLEIFRILYAICSVTSKDSQFCSFKHHVLSHHPKEILTLDNFLLLRKEVVVGTSELNPEEEAAGDDGPPGVIGPPGEDAPPGMEVEGEKVSILSFVSLYKI